MAHRFLIKVPNKLIVIILIFMISTITLIILIGNKVVTKYKQANIETEIDSKIIFGNEKYGYLRGAVFYSKNKYVSASATLIGDNPTSNIWKSAGPIKDFDDIPYRHTLNDLSFPYSLKKKEKNDTIFVQKDKYKLKFLMHRWEKKKI